MTRHHHDGLRKRCGCPRLRWSKCAHPWYLAYQWRGQRHRVSLDRLVGRQLRGKTEADAEADRIREEIRAGTFQTGATPAPPANHSVTVSAFGAIFLERYSKARGKVTWRDDEVKIGKVLAFILPRTGHTMGASPDNGITEDDCDVFLTSLRERHLAASTRNKYLQLLKAMSRWGLHKGYLERPWILPGSDLKREKHAKRDRRLRPDEEDRLLEQAAPRLYRLVVAALETGCRLGELLALRWRDVDLKRGEVRIQAITAKSRKIRHIPIVARLRAVLDLARYDPSGQPFGPDAHVFGDEVGRRLQSQQKAWESAVLKAHGHTPTWVKTALSPQSRAAFRGINLRFHDLRHEAGSRWLEKGLPLHHVKELLGHASIATTDTYLNASRIHLRESMLAMEQRGKNGTQVTQSTEKQAAQDAQEQRKNGDNLLIN